MRMAFDDVEGFDEEEDYIPTHFTELQKRIGVTSYLDRIALIRERHRKFKEKKHAANLVLE